MITAKPAASPLSRLIDALTFEQAVVLLAPNVTLLSWTGIQEGSLLTTEPLVPVKKLKMQTPLARLRLARSQIERLLAAT